MVRMCSPVWRSRVGWAATSSWGSSTSSSSPGWWARPAVLYSMVLALWRWENSYYNFSELIFCVKIYAVHTWAVLRIRVFLSGSVSDFFSESGSESGKISHPDWDKFGIRIKKFRFDKFFYRYCYQYYFLRKLKQIIEWIRIVVLEKLLSRYHQ